MACEKLLKFILRRRIVTTNLVISTGGEALCPKYVYEKYFDIIHS